MNVSAGFPSFPAPAPAPFSCSNDRVFEKRGKNRVMKRGEQGAGSRKQEAGAGAGQE